MILKNFKSVKHAANMAITELLISGGKELAGKWQATDKFADMKMLVLRNYFLSITNIDWCDSCLAIETGCDIAWCNMHFEERISGNPTNPGEAYKHWPYHKNLDESEFKDDKFSHTYQERFWPKAVEVYTEDVQRHLYLTGKLNINDPDNNIGLRFPLGDLEDVIQQLADNHLTRQAFLPIWFPEDTWAANNSKRVPCTLGYYFYIQGGKLHCNYIIRSCDAYRHFRNDLYLTLKLQKYVAEEIGIEPGNLDFLIFNFHIFENDMYSIQKKENKIRGYEFGKNN